MRLSFLLASVLTFGLTSATASVVPRAPAPATSTDIPQQCQSACSALSDTSNAVLAGGSNSAAATAAACSSTNFQNIKSCWDCGYNLAPTAFTPSMVQSVQSAVDNFAAECNKLGFSVKSVNLAGSGKSSSGAALSRYDGSAKIAGAVGVVAVAGLLAL